MYGLASQYLIDILAILLATVVVVPIFHTIRLGAILGYLTAGMILGPWGLEVITEIKQIRHLAEFGVIFLLFILGMELKPDKLWHMRRLVIGLGLGQLFITSGLIFSIAIWLDISQQSAIIIGFGLALSSTAFCLRLLSERGGIVTLMGRMSFSVLLLQDLAVIPLLALISYLAGSANAHIEHNLNIVYSILVIIVLLFVGRYLLNPILDKVVASQDPEVFIAMAVLLVLGVAWIMESIGLTMALGAFIAGMMLAESHYRPQIEADILPFRGILLGLFFMTVGMNINFALLWEQLVIILLLTIALMTLKAIVVYILARIGGALHDVSIQIGVLLSQSGEFGFVMFNAAYLAGILEAQLNQLLNLIITLTMILTPFLVKIANLLLLRLYKPATDEKDTVTEFVNNSEDHVIIAGFGRVGARIAALLSAASVPYIAIDMRQQRVKTARAQGFPVFFGDASKVKVLQASGAKHAKMIVVALEEPEQIDGLVMSVHRYYPDMPIHARAKDRQHCATLITQGATTTVSETLETSLRLTEKVLLGNGVDKEMVRSVIDEFRDDYYSNVVKKITENKVVLGELRH